VTLRVGIDIRTAAATEPGQQRYLWRLGEWIGSLGHEVAFLTVRNQPEDIESPAGTTLHRLAELSVPGIRRHVTELALDALLLNPERARRYRGVGANVLRAGYGTEHYVQNLRSVRNPLARSLRTAARLAPWTLADLHWERRFYEAPDPAPDVVAQSVYMKDLILGSYRIPEDHIHLVPNAIDTSEYNPERRAALRDEMRARWEIPPEAVCLLFLGHNFRRKGLWELLDALPRLTDTSRPVHLLVAGKGTGNRQRKSARARVEALGIADRVHFAGPVRPSVQAIAAADALVFLSWHDAFGWVTIEAMGCGLPVVTTPYAGSSELIRHGETGFVVDPADDGAVEAAFRALLDDGSRQRIGVAAAEVAAKLDEPRNFAQVFDVMQTAAARGRGPVRAL